MEEEILKTVVEACEKSGGANGINVVGISEKTGIKIADIKPVINKLYKEKKVFTKQSINDLYIYDIKWKT